MRSVLLQACVFVARKVLLQPHFTAPDFSWYTYCSDQAKGGAQEGALQSLLTSMNSEGVRSKAGTWSVIILLAAALYLARAIFLPIALAILFAFLLSPLVVRLRRWGWRKVPAVIAVVLAAFLILAVFGAIFVFQLTDLTQALPRYKENIQAKLRTLTQSSQGTLRRLINTFEFEVRTNSLPYRGTNAFERKPIPVEMHEPATTPMKLMRSVLGNLLNPVATAAMVIVLVLVMLLQREDLRNRLLRLLGSGRLNVSTQALDEAAQRVSRYLLMQLLVNVGYGVLIGVGLRCIGIPNALGWGILATLLRFIPYVGPVMAAAFPVALAIAVDPGWVKLVLTILLFVFVELLVGYLVEPWLYGSIAGISAFAVIMAVCFWTWLWGPVGLLLATPLTVCLAVLGRYVPRLEFLHILLSDERVLPDEARFYQRLLANDEDEASEVAQETLASHSLTYLYDSVLIPALSLAERDLYQGTLEAQRYQYILNTTRQLIEELEVPGQTLPPPNEVTPGRPVSLLCIPAKDEADEVCGLMLARLLREQHIFAQCVSATFLANERFQEIRRGAVSVVCVSALPPSALLQARLFCKRLRSEFPELKVVVGVWTRTPDLARIHSRLPAGLINHVVTSLSEAVQIIRPLAATEPVASEPILSRSAMSC